MSSSEASSSISDAEFDVSKDMEIPGEETNLKRKRTSAAGKQSNASKKSSKNRLAYTDSEEEDEDEEMLAEEEKGKKKKITGKSEPTGNLADYEYVITPEKSVASGQNINVDEDSESDLEISEDSESETQESSSQKRRSRRDREDEDSSEESLEEFFTGHSKKDKNRLTSRQRAKLDDEFQVELLELPTESKKKHLTAEEMALKRSETARRRKNQSERRAEQDKMDTINKLLKKQASRRTKKDDDEQEQRDREVNALTKIYYLQNKEGVTVSFPIDANPIPSQKFTGYPPSLPKCSIPGCERVKKYRHPKLLRDICSLEHYRMLEA